MQTVETLNEGLKRAYTLKITAKDIDSRVDAELKRVAPTVRMPGFRPGKVPANLVRKMHGEALMQDALNTSIQQGIQELIAEHKLRPALQPSVSLDDGYELGKDADVKVELEVLPDVPTPAIDNLKLERLTVPADEAVVQEQLQKFADQQKRWEEADAAYEAKTGDLVVLDFVGKVDGVAFDGGTGEDMSVEIGSGRLIPGFEEQVVGVKAGDERQINVTFPEDYQAKELAGKAATFDVTVKALKAPKDSAIDDEFAKRLGLESLDKLKELLRDNLNQQYKGAARFKLKRALLDQLDEQHSFDLPPKMVEAEFDGIWQQVEADKEAGRLPEADAKKSEKKLKEEYRKIAERRVRLGLVLAEIGRENNVTVTDQELNNAIIAEARNYPGQEQQVLEFYRQNQNAAASMRAPIYEEKVCDLIFDKAKVKDTPITKEELLKEDDEE